MIKASESMLFSDKKLIIKEDNAVASTDDLQKSGSTSPLKVKIPDSSHDFQFHKFLTPNKW